MQNIIHLSRLSPGIFPFPGGVEEFVRNDDFNKCDSREMIQNYSKSKTPERSLGRYKSWFQCLVIPLLGL